jgi:hypothetical protein
MLGIWSIAKHTFFQCVRMKLAVTFVVLLAVAMVALPAGMTGDGTLAGQIRAFMAYGTGIAMGLLSIMTIFVGASLVSNDIRTKQIFTVVVKPVARWQYLLGRWVGLVMFNAVLLTMACVGIYATVEYLRTKEFTDQGRVSLMDRRTVETEIFAARRKLRPDPLDLQSTVAQRIKQMQADDDYETAVKKRLDEANGDHVLAGKLLRRDIEREIIAEETDPLALDTALANRVKILKDTGKYQSALEGWMPRANGDKKRAEWMLLDQLRMQIGSKLQSIAPSQRRWWSFTDVSVSGREIHQKAHVTTPLDKTGTIRVRTPESFACRLWIDGPVKINDFAAAVLATDGRIVVVRVLKGGGGLQSLSNLSEGDTVELLVKPIVQIAYKLTRADHESAPGDNFLCWWRANDGDRPGIQWSKLSNLTQQKVTIPIPADIVGKDGKLRFGILNDASSPTNVEVLFRDVALMYNVDTFENNFIRASVLMLCQLIYLSAASIFAGSLVSFPVACLLSFVLGPFSLARDFLIDAVKFSVGGDPDIVMWLAHYVFIPFNMLLPDFARTMPGDRLIDGMDISWAFVGDTALADVVIRASVAMLLACIIFYRRELARVQV